MSSKKRSRELGSNPRVNEAELAYMWFMKKNNGFTLIEVLVALVIVGIALPAMVFRVQSILEHTSYIEEKTYAYWIAQNKMQELVLLKNLQNVVPKAKQNDAIEYAGRTWYWKVDAQKTPVEKMYRLTVSVGPSEDNMMANLSAFMNDK